MREGWGSWSTRSNTWGKRHGVGYEGGVGLGVTVKQLNHLLRERPGGVCEGAHRWSGRRIGLAVLEAVGMCVKEKQTARSSAERAQRLQAEHTLSCQTPGAAALRSLATVAAQSFSC